MSMNKLIKEVTECVEREYGRAGAQFGLTNHSDHESYAVILEELQEAKVDVEAFERELSMFWEMIKADDSDLHKYARLMQMHQKALLGACELIQVAAMAKKALITISDRGTLREFKGEGTGCREAH